jgi:hypothetical protein
MAVTRQEITDRSMGDHLPLAVTVRRASELSGLGLTSIWSFLRDGRLEAVRVAGIRRTLVSYPSLTRLLGPPSASVPPPRKGGRPRKETMHEATP